MEFIYRKDLIKRYPFGANKINEMIQKGVFKPMKDPITGERKGRGKRQVFLASKCDAIIEKLFEDGDE